MDRTASLIGILLWLSADRRKFASSSAPFRFSAAALRQSLLAAFAARSPKIPAPFRSMGVQELKPPSYPPDWLEGFVDPGEFLKPYKQIPARLRVGVLNDHWRQITKLKEIAEPLEGLEQVENSKAGYFAAGDSVGQCGLFLLAVYTAASSVGEGLLFNRG
jgi:hypothetical protein